MDLVNQYRSFDKFVRSRAIKRRNYFRYLQQKLSEALTNQYFDSERSYSLSSYSENQKFSKLNGRTL